MKQFLKAVLGEGGSGERAKLAPTKTSDGMDIAQM